MVRMSRRERRFRWERRRPGQKRPPEPLRPDAIRHHRPASSTPYNQVRRYRYRRWVLLPGVPAAARWGRRALGAHTLAVALTGVAILGAGAAIATTGAASSSHRPAMTSTTRVHRRTERTADASPTGNIDPAATVTIPGAIANPVATTPTRTIPVSTPGAAQTAPAAALLPLTLPPISLPVTLPPVTLPAVTLTLPPLTLSVTLPPVTLP